MDFFRIYRGLELDDVVQFLSGTGAPGSTADTDAAGVGSYYTNQANGDLWTKVATGSGVDKWRLQATQNYVQTMLATGISWREPVRVADTSSTTVPTGTPGNPITIDSISISNGQRVLFTAISGGGGPNVYIYDQAAGVFVEDTNNETDGDTVFIQEGTSADSTWQFDGTAWNTITTGTANAELGYIRDYIGKPSAGAILPDYTSTNVVADNDTHTAAISKLDAEAGFVRTFIGKGPGADTPNYTSETFVTDGDSLETAIGKLDAALTQTSKTSSATNVTSVQTIDSATSSVTEWDVFIREVATPTRVWAGKVFAMHNGVAVDYTNFAILKLNGNINGLSVTVTLTGGDTLNLRVASSSAVDVKAQRLASFN
jgi:hypothetical protein